MKASVCKEYGGPDVLSVKEVEKPSPRDNEVLVKVYATTVNRTDLGILRASPFIIRLFTGLFRPRLSITGTDFAGQVEATGNDVTAFKAGDRVMGFDGMGLQSHAEYMTVPQNKAIILIPSGMSYDVAAASLEAAFYANCSINELRPVGGQKALVYGATGAIGSSMVQILKYHGVYVTAVCGGENIDLVKSLGAERIIDYKKEDFTKDEEKYDFVLDAVGKSSFSRCKPLLREKGIYSSTDKFVNLLLALVTPVFGGKKVVFKPPKNTKAGIGFIRDLVDRGDFKPVIDRKYPIDHIREAFAYVATGQKVGNVVITMGS
jgi:NADPH:quinone reductase-like Zn-dependent oxidoreductase